jgi:hypothetical protein
MWQHIKLRGMMLYTFRPSTFNDDDRLKKQANFVRSMVKKTRAGTLVNISKELRHAIWVLVKKIDQSEVIASKLRLRKGV